MLPVEFLHAAETAHRKYSLLAERLELNAEADELRAAGKLSEIESDLLKFYNVWSARLILKLQD